jgi:hypothetical protein
MNTLVGFDFYAQPGLLNQEFLNGQVYCQALTAGDTTAFNNQYIYICSPAE